MNRKNLGVLSLLLIALEGFISFAFLLSVPADPKNAVFLGYSPVRLAVAAGIGLGIFLFGAGALLLLIKPRFEKALLDRLYTGRLYGFALGGSSILLLASWILVWMPYARFGPWQAYAERFWPVVLWLALASLQSVTFLLVFRAGLDWVGLNQTLSRQKAGLLAAVGVFGSALITLIVILATGWGLDPDGMHWNSPGVPILGLQLLAAWLLALGMMGFSGRVDAAEKKPWIDAILFVVIWAAAAGLWFALPAQRSYFAPGPYAPNQQVYPFSDAEVYDLGAQFGLIGQKFNNFGYVDKPLYTFLLFLFHALAGQSTREVLLLQNLLLAFLPACVYLLGKHVYQRGAGVLAAVLVIFWNLNAYDASLYVQVTHTRLLMSELPTGLMLALFTLLLVGWLKSAGRGLAGILAAGGVLGLATLLRHNPWLLLPVVPVVVFARFYRSWRRWLPAAAGFILVFGLAILPWMVRSNQSAHTPWYFMIPLKGSVIENRYEPAFEGREEPNPEALPGPSAPSEPQERTPVEPVPSQPDLSGAAASEPIPTQAIPTEPGGGAPPAPAPAAGMSQKILSAADFVLRHFLHNLLASVLVFPTSPVNDTLTQVLQRPGSYWRPDWNGTLPVWDGIVLIAHLLVMSIGVGTAWRKTKIAGVVPLVVFLVYHLATAVARTSGGRYIQPAQWVVFLYYGAGWLQLCAWGAALVGRRNGIWAEQIPVDLPDEAVGFPRLGLGAAAVVIAFGLLGLAIPLAEGSVAPRYSSQDPAQLADELRELGVGSPTGGAEELQSLISSPGAVIVKGRALYPRYYGQGQGEPARGTVYSAQPYPRLAFTVIGASGVSRVDLPLGTALETFPDGADVLVVGCTQKGTLDAAGVIFLNGPAVPNTSALWRSPAAPLRCPLKPPVCDNNHTCR